MVNRKCNPPDERFPFVAAYMEYWTLGKVHEVAGEEINHRETRGPQFVGHLVETYCTMKCVERTVRTFMVASIGTEERFDSLR